MEDVFDRRQLQELLRAKDMESAFEEYYWVRNNFDARKISKIYSIVNQLKRNGSITDKQWSYLKYLSDQRGKLLETLSDTGAVNEKTINGGRR